MRKWRGLSEAKSDDFTDDDLDFISAQAEQQNELDYSPFDSDPDAQPVSIDQPIAKPTPSAQHSPSPQQDQPAPHDQDATPFSSAKSPLRSSEPPGQEPDSKLADQLPDELLLEAPELGLDFDETESDDDESDYLIESLAPNLDDEETDELAWDDYDDLDEFDEQARRESPVEPQGEGAVSREIRARQAAVELLLTCDWHPSTIDLLQQIFVDNGWGAARVAIEHEIEKGLLPDELVLARFVRAYWSENERFWTTYHRIKANAPCMAAAAVYRHMSWAEALRIVRCFPALPASEEVMELIEDAYEWWYADRNLRRSFKTFFKFLKYRTGSMRGALPGHCVFSFFEWPEDDSASESIGPLNPITKASQYLQDLGIQLPLACEPPPRNIMSIRKEPEE